MRRLTVSEAGEVLGITTDAARMRLSRGTLRSEKHSGRVYVLLDDDITTDISGVTESTLIDAKDETISILREQLQAEREAHAEARRIIAALTSRIPQLEAPSETRGSPRTPRVTGTRFGLAGGREAFELPHEIPK
jgi:hypothetical protein